MCVSLQHGEQQQTRAKGGRLGLTVLIGVRYPCCHGRNTVRQRCVRMRANELSRCMAAS